MSQSCHVKNAEYKKLFDVYSSNAKVNAIIDYFQLHNNTLAYPTVEQASALLKTVNLDNKVLINQIKENLKKRIGKLKERINSTHSKNTNKEANKNVLNKLLRQLETSKEEEISS